MAYGIHNGAPAAAFPLNMDRDMAGAHNCFKNGACAASLFPHNKILMP